MLRRCGVMCAEAAARHAFTRWKINGAILFAPTQPVQVAVAESRKEVLPSPWCRGAQTALSLPFSREQNCESQTHDTS